MGLSLKLPFSLEASFPVKRTHGRNVWCLPVAEGILCSGKGSGNGLKKSLSGIEIKMLVTSNDTNVQEHKSYIQPAIHHEETDTPLPTCHRKGSLI